MSDDNLHVHFDLTSIENKHAKRLDALSDILCGFIQLYMDTYQVDADMVSIMFYQKTDKVWEMAITTD